MMRNPLDGYRPAAWLRTGARVAAVLGLLVGVAAALAWCATAPVRVPSAAATGRAALALGDSGRFALPRSAGRVVAQADAESAAVARAYWWVEPVMSYEPRRREPRRPCGRTYYVAPFLDPLPAGDSLATMRYY